MCQIDCLTQIEYYNDSAIGLLRTWGEIAVFVLFCFECTITNISQRNRCNFFQVSQNRCKTKLRVQFMLSKISFRVGKCISSRH